MASNKSGSRQIASGAPARKRPEVVETVDMPNARRNPWGGIKQPGHGDRGPDMPVAVVILAAGQGKRMRSKLPKVLQPLAGRPLLAHVLETAGELKPEAIHVVYGHGGDLVRERLADVPTPVPVQWVLQAEQLGTGHAVLQAAPRLLPQQRVLILYGDVPLITPETLFELLEGCGPNSLSLLTVELEDPEGYGRVIRDERGRVKAIVEDKDATTKQRAITECNTGIMAVPARHLLRWLTQLGNANSQGEYYLTDVIAAAVKDGVVVTPLPADSEEEVQGVNDKVQLSMVEASYRLSQAVDLMEAGVTVIDPLRLDVRGTVEPGSDVTLDVNVVLEGRVVLGDGVSIGPNCVIRDATIGAGTQIAANSIVERSTIGADCRVGPFARVRPESVLADQVHIGNFVEVKKTTLGAGSKANHLTYLGDAVIGAAVNVGAGTVTCNYDGVNKSTTTIGDGAFIGSGSMLVAPVTIGANATIGAGSTITREAPADKLTLERSKQTTLEGWQRPEKK